MMLIPALMVWLFVLQIKIPSYRTGGSWCFQCHDVQIYFQRAVSVYDPMSVLGQPLQNYSPGQWIHVLLKNV